MAIIEHKSRGEITTMEAIPSLLKTFLEGGSITAFSHYVEQLAEVEIEWVTTLKQGSNTIPPISREDNVSAEMVNEPPITEKNKLSQTQLRNQIQTEQSAWLMDHYLHEGNLNQQNYLSTQLELTLKLKWNYHLDVRAGKSKIVNHPLCPIFPDGL